VATGPTANEIKTQLIALLTPVIATTGTKKAKILDYLPLAYLLPEGEDPTVLKSPLDTTTLAGGSTDKRVNCLMITELGFEQTPPQQDATRLIQQPRGQNLITRRFGLAYVYQFGTGSEAVFSTNVEVIRTTLNDAPKLGFAVSTAGIAGQGAWIKDHSGLQVPSMLPISCSGIICHPAEGTLAVRIIEPLEQR
jgi:hypothetical protein